MKLSIDIKDSDKNKVAIVLKQHGINFSILGEDNKIKVRTINYNDVLTRNDLKRFLDWENYKELRVVGADKKIKRYDSERIAKYFSHFINDDYRNKYNFYEGHLRRINE